MLLQLFVGVVDAELLEAVLFETLETEDIQDAELMDSLRVTSSLCEHLRLDISVDLAHNPIKQFAIDSLGTRIARRDSLVFLEWCHDYFAADLGNFSLKGFF